MTTFLHGAKAGIKFGSTAAPATLTDYSAYTHMITFPQTRDQAETTTFGVTTKSFIPGLRDATIQIDAYFNTVIDGAFQDLMTNPVAVNFQYAPNGFGSTGTPLYAGLMFIDSYQLSTDTQGVGKISVKCQISGNVTRSIQ